MRIWVFCFVLLFGSAELLQWIRQFSLPLPVFILGGVFLAVASNYDKLKGLPFHLDLDEPDSDQADPPPSPSAQKTQVTPSARPPERSISFTIQKPFQPGD